MFKPLFPLLLLALTSAATAQTPAPATSVAPASIDSPKVALETSMGTIVLELYPEKSPKTVANFLRYVRDDFYAGTVFHRIIPGFLVQGGIYDQQLQEKRTRPAIPDEADNGLSNLRGTIAAARAPEAPRSATSQFFINLVDNRRLDFVSDRNGLTWGYAVFGKVIEGMDVVDAMAALPTIPLGPFAGDVPKPLVVITAARVMEQEQPASASTSELAQTTSIRRPASAASASLP